MTLRLSAGVRYVSEQSGTVSKISARCGSRSSVISVPIFCSIWICGLIVKKGWWFGMRSGVVLWACLLLLALSLLRMCDSSESFVWNFLWRLVLQASVLNLGYAGRGGALGIRRGMPWMLTTLVGVGLVLREKDLHR